MRAGEKRREGEAYEKFTQLVIGYISELCAVVLRYDELVYV